MHLVLALLLLIPVSLVIFYIPFYFSAGFRKHKYSKFVPSAICAVIAAIFGIKFPFFQVGYSEILDVVVIGFFSILFFIYLGVALMYILTFKKH